MSGQLAVIVSQFGTVSETFVRRHIEDLFPGKTVVISLNSSHPLGGRWEAAQPALFLDQWAQQIAIRGSGRIGLPVNKLREARIIRFFQQHGVQWVLGEYLDVTVKFVPILDRLQIPYIVQGHGIDVSATLRDPQTKQSYSKLASARAILTRCDFHRQRLVDLGLPAEKIHVNPGGIDLPESAPEKDNQSSKRILAIGRMTAKKGPIFLLEAFRRALAVDPKLSLDYVGGGEWAGAARQFVDACDIQSSVRFHGMVSEAQKNELLRSCGIFAQHSVTDPDTGDEEGLPAAIQEAMAFGMAVVSTRHSGIPELVEHGRSGLLVKEGDAADMAEAIVALARDPDRVREMGRTNRQIIAAGHTWDQERQRLLTHLKLPV